MALPSIMIKGALRVLCDAFPWFLGKGGGWGKTVGTFKSINLNHSQAYR